MQINPRIKNGKTIVIELGLYSLILSASSMAWLTMAGGLPTLATGFNIVVFMVGLTCWAMLSRSLWPSHSTLNSYLPIGFSLASGLSLLLIEAHLGTTLAAILGCLVASMAFSKRHFGENQSNRFNPYNLQQKKIALEIVQLIMAICLATFMMTDQLNSARSLSNPSVDSVINSWTDVILHANTVIGFANLPFGLGPVSTLDPFKPLHPYHFGTYILPALIASGKNAASPLIAYLSICSPLGLTLLTLPLIDRLLQGRKGKALIGALTLFSAAVLVYAIWTKLTIPSIFDPIWLLLTTPALLYACAVVLAILQISTNLQTKNQNSIAQASLGFLMLTLTLHLKFQLWHAILIFCFILIARNLFPWPRQRSLPWLGIGILTSVLCVLQLFTFDRLGILRAHPIKSFLYFLSGVTAAQQPFIYAHSHSIAHAGHLFSALLGAAMLCGPIFFLGWVLANNNQRCLVVPKGLVLFLLISFFLGILIGPEMPWDPAEFQNRSWPLLWCVGFWLLAGYRIPKETDRTLSAVCLVFVMLISAWILLPSYKRKSAAQTASMDWTINQYPTIIKSKYKRQAANLASLSTNDLFFVRAEKPYTLLVDHASMLAALSGRRPLFSRIGFQLQGQIGRDKESKSKELKSHYNSLTERADQSCSDQPLSGASRIELGHEVPIQWQGPFRAWALCEPTGKNGPAR